MRKFKKYLIFLIIIIVLVVGAAGLYIYMDKQYKKNLITYQDPHLNPNEAQPFVNQINETNELLKQQNLSDQDKFKLYMNLGDQQRALGQLENARESYETAHGLIKDNVAALQQLSLVAELMHDYKAAIDYMNTAIKIDPISKQTYQQRIDELKKKL